MSNDYAGNGAVFPAVIRTPAGGENRNSTVFDRGLEDLADRTAYLLGQTPAAIEVVTTAALKALTTAQPPIRFVRGFGWYSYEATYTFGADVAPWFYPATGIGSGAWVRCDWNPLLGGDTTRTQLAAALVLQTITAFGAETSAAAIAADSTATSLSPVPLTNTTPTNLTSASLTLVAGTTVKLSAGPFYVTAPASAYAGQIGIKAGSGNIFGIAELAAGTSSTVTLAVDYVAAADETVAFSLVGRVLGGALPVHVAAPAECQWLRYTVMKVPT